MERKNFKIEDAKVQKNVQYIYDNALGNPVILQTAPAKDDVKANNLAVHGSDIYLRTASGTLLKLTATEVK